MPLDPQIAALLSMLEAPGVVPMHAGTDITSARYIAGETPRFAQLPLASAAALRGTAQALRARLEGAMA